jgi:sugar O-acyltransferase (sialic acid O-acetyltransferase NeuD family)
MTAELIFWGAGCQAKVLRECFQGMTVTAVFDNDPDLRSPFAGVPLYHGRKGFEDWLRQQPKAPSGFLVAIGGDRGKDRIAIQDYLEEHGLTALVARHRTAFVAADAQIGAGTQILAQSAVCVEARIGRGCIVNTGATVDHECILGDGVHVAPGAHLAGCVQVGAFAMIGIGAVVLPRLRIGEGAIIGAGAVVTKNVEANSIMVGQPARPLVRANHDRT